MFQTLLSKKIKKIKKMFNKHEKKQYDHFFKHKQMKLLYSKIALKFNKNTSLNFLYNEEKNLANTNIDENMFVKSFEKLAKDELKEVNWKAFGKFIWYIFQTSKFWYDFHHKNNENIYSKENVITLNSIKRNYFNIWIKSLDPQIENLNEKIIYVLKKVF